MSARLYPAHFEAIASALQAIFLKGNYADKEISRVLKEDKKRGSKDRAFIAEQTYGVVRNYRLLKHLAELENPTSREDFWRLTGAWLLHNGTNLPGWKEFGNLSRERVEERMATVDDKRAVRESIPDWLDALGTDQLGDNWGATLTALNEQAPVVLRTNRLKTTPEELIKALAKESILTEHIAADALLVTERRNLFATKAFKAGHFELQDFSSQQAAPSLDVDPSHTVIDACAGAGGKSLHLAALMQNRGKLLSLDVHNWKLEELKKRAKRAGVNNLETRAISSTKIVKRLTERADRLLLDVPCSGLGVLRRNPDAKWKLNPDFLERVITEQADILARYSRMVKPGGKMVYATCSILPRENDDQVDRFLNEEAGKDWTLARKHTYLPQVEGYDGFFVSVLDRT
ncbi:RsmB/NOP family class I SAM-dependent RNA methyltransferase [Neolewinella antarctica]|uniref:16S rRNA (Cytosine967-C5)-methyltransferase n=1 Tax=Neolewinella antarctica TaxID=442734 RepID=A0ABX0X623_9BACT|nr:methyltransferase domain-containing protein [Neolewinella antarctica]NJC24656.1 16S rRNA (cytosine967-C5)-methyltransferase [Neolewinella antarctica]